MPSNSTDKCIKSVPALGASTGWPCQAAAYATSLYFKRSMEENRINLAKYQIYKYVEEHFVCLCELIRDDLDELMNRPSHGLSQKELEILLFELFSEYKLVAMKDVKGFFTPSLNEIEEALKEEKDFMSISENTFYGITTGAIEEFRALEKIYGEKT